MNLATLNKSLSFIILASVLALSACGKKKKNGGPAPGGGGPTPGIAVPPPTPDNTMYNNVSGGDHFSQYFAGHQSAFGNIVIVNPTQSGWGPIAAGTYSWAKFYEVVIAKGAQHCVSQYTGCGSQNGQWGQFNYGYFYNQYSYYWTSSASYVTGGTATNGASMNVTLSQLMNAFYGSIYSTYSSGYYGSYNGGYSSYPSSYQPYYGYGTGGYMGGSYSNSGSGWNFSIGAGGSF